MYETTDPVVPLAQADLLLLLAAMFRSPAAWSETECEIEAADLRALAARSGLAEIPGAAGLLQDAVSIWRAVDRGAAAAEHARMFDGVQACAPNETIFVRRDKGAVLADIAGFYRAFGFELAGDFREKHDHIQVELQFLAMLLVLIGRALESGGPERYEVAHGALRAFLADHFGVWVASFAERLEASSMIEYYSVVARLLAAVWITLKTNFAIENVELNGQPAVEDSGTPYECGMCSEGNANTAESSNRP